MLKVLLIGPTTASSGGEATYIKNLINFPPRGVKYTYFPYIEKLIEKSASYLFNMARRKIPFHDHMTKFFTSSNLLTFDLIHSHIFSIKIIGSYHKPIILGDSSCMFALKESYLNWSKIHKNLSLAIGKCIFKLLRINDTLTNIKHVSYILTWSKIAKKVYISYGVPEEKIKVVPPGLPDPPVKKIKRNDEQVRFLFIGADFYRKGGDIILNAYKILKDKYPTISLTMVTSLPSFITLPNDIIILKPMERSKLFKDVYPYHDVLLMGSRSEGFGLTTVEAMSVGLPVIAKNTFSLPEIVEHGKTGFIFNTLEELIKYMSIVIEDETMRSKMCKMARESFKNRYHLNITNQKLSLIYEQCIL